MIGVLALLVAGLASVQGYTCLLCQIPGQEYCCTDFMNNDSHYCCSAEQFYYKGGFLDQKTIIIAASVVAAVFLLLILCCCCCCSCCPCYRRRRAGAVYNSVVSQRGPACQQSAPYYPAQYPPQHPSNPYLAPNASAPVYPTLPSPSQA